MKKAVVLFASAGLVCAGLAVSARAQTAPANVATANPAPAKAEPLGLFAPGKSGWASGKVGSTPASYFSGHRKAGTLIVPEASQEPAATKK